MKQLYLIIGIGLLSSCGMNWDNGGREELKANCMQQDYRLSELNYMIIDMNATCDCFVEKSEVTYESYEEALMNLEELFEKELEYCASQNAEMKPL